MNGIFKFLRATITGGIVFLLPIVIVILVVNKAYAYLKILSEPFVPYFSRNSFFGWDGHNIFTIILLIAICFIFGLLFHSIKMRRGVSFLETNLLNLLPGYILVKSLLTERLHVDDQTNLQAVLMQDGEGFRPGLIVEESENGYCTVYFPDAPKCESGEIRIIPVSSIRKLNIPAHRLTMVIRRLGKGGIQMVEASAKR